MITYKILRVWEKLQPNDEFLSRNTYKWCPIPIYPSFEEITVNDFLKNVSSALRVRRKEVVKKRRIG